MSFRILDVQALLLAGLLFGLFPAAKAQSNGGGQHILFSSPDGRITSNAPLPMAQAPEPQETPNLPDGEAATPQFSGPPPVPMFFEPPPAMQQDDARSRNDPQNPTDFRKQMGLLTPAQIMNVPSAEQIFGLAEKPTEPQKKPAQSQNAATNDLAPDATAIIGQPGWANKAWPGDTEKGVQSSNTTEKASGLFDGFFDTARSDDVFGNHSARNPDALSGPSQASQAAPQQSPWGSQLTMSDFAPSAPAAEAVPNGFTPTGPSSPDWTSQSPFTPPQVSTLDTLPKLPALPSLQPQNDPFNHAAPAPTWGPKPPPWTQPQTPLGTPAPLNPGR